MLTIILVCPTDRLPTRYRQVANRSPTVGRLLADSRPTLWPQTSADCCPTVGRLLPNCRPTVGQQLANSRPTVDRQSADRFFGELFFTITFVTVINFVQCLLINFFHSTLYHELLFALVAVTKDLGKNKHTYSMIIKKAKGY